LTRVVVAIDPAVTSGQEADETGIVVAGKDKDGHGYVLADISGRYPPTEWARLVIAAYATHGADRIVAEVNNGGDMVGATLRMVDPNVPFSAVRASRGKVVRAEPVAALYQPMKSEGIYELYRRYAEAAEQRDKPQPTKTVYAPGSMEWFEAQKKKG
jgi:phage terminase large subunit-like protein